MGEATALAFTVVLLALSLLSAWCFRLQREVSDAQRTIVALGEWLLRSDIQPLEDR